MVLQLDFEACEARAKTMTDSALHYALVDIEKTLPLARAMDRIGVTHGGKTEGYYCDEASVYRKELKNRRNLSN
jgi:hypothetical protein